MLNGQLTRNDMITQVLNGEQIQQANQRSLEILERVGVSIPHPDMLRRFSDAGARVDFASQRVRIPATLVRQLIASAGKQFTLYGRDLSRRAPFGQGARNYNSIAGEANWLDAPGTNHRFARMEDVATAARFADALEMINIAGAMADPHETPVGYSSVEVCARLIKNTTKPFLFWFHDRASAHYIVEILTALRGNLSAAAEKPACFVLLEPISPLRFPFNGIDLLYETARAGIPVAVGPMAQMGVSAPATLAGTMCLENAEVMAGICVTQLVKAGLPVCYGGICHAFDMRTTQLIFAGPEQAIFGVAMTEIGKSHGLPVYINVGLTDSKLPDAQAGLEAIGTLLPGVAAGADIFGHMGISGVDQAASLDLLLLQHEVIRYVESAMREVVFGSDSVPLGLIDEIGPGGTYLDTEHTVRNFRQSLFVPHLLDRQYYPTWLKAGASAMADRIAARKQSLLAHIPAPPPEDLERELDSIVAAARQHLRAG